MFRSPHGRTHLFQIVFSRGNVGRDSYPMSRRFIYETSAQSPTPRAPAPLSETGLAQAAAGAGA
jgi:hypothetical protein